MLVITSKKRRGRGLVNTAINNLPVELHIPGYRYCGTGTRLKERLARGDQPINPLDKCMEHDKIYAEHRADIAKRHAADRELAKQAWQRVKSRDASMRESSSFSRHGCYEDENKTRSWNEKKDNLKKDCRRSETNYAEAWRDSDHGH